MSPVLLSALLLLLLGIGLTAGHTDPAPPPQNPDPTVCLNKFEYERTVIEKILMCEAKQKKIKKIILKQDDQLYFLSKKLKALYLWYKNNQGNTGGATYTRWGRTTCPPDAELVYEGYAGGSCFNHQGGASNPVCLPKDPDWTNAHYDDNIDNHSAFMYGGEYEMGSRNSRLYFPTITNTINNHHDLPCAVCCTKKSKVMMLPAKTQCPTGWGLEYKGYLSAGYHNARSASEYVCLDGEPQVGTGGQSNANGYIFLFVEARCGSLKCPPYVNGRELTCSVCSK